MSPQSTRGAAGLRVEISHTAAVMIRRTTLWVCALALCQSLACARARPNVLLIVIDTLRPDRLGVYGDTRGLTPFLDSLAAGGFVFRNTYAQSSWTNASVASLFTSRYQSQHHVTSFTSILAEEELTLAEVLREHGYVTGGFSANILVRPQLGFGQGFDRYEPYTRTEKDMFGRPMLIKERAERVNRGAFTWLEELRQGGNRQPVFLYLHYMEPHNPYDPPATLLDRVLAGRPRPDLAAVNDRMRLPNFGTFSDELVRDVKDLYDAEVIAVDAQIRALFDDLRGRGFLDDCLIIVTADHGEEFREHGLMGHHQTLYEEVIRIPLIILVPGHATPVQVTPLVSLIDLPQTVLDFAGFDAPPSFVGRSLRTLMNVPRRGWWPFGDAPALLASDGSGVMSELIKGETQRARPHERAVVADSAKVIVDVDGTQSFYDLRTDPGETNPQSLTEPARATLVSALGHFGRYARSPAGRATMEMDPETRERMRALGYAE